jgi:hypothetical protein
MNLKNEVKKITEEHYPGSTKPDIDKEIIIGLLKATNDFIEVLDKNLMNFCTELQKIEVKYDQTSRKD